MVLSQDSPQEIFWKKLSSWFLGDLRYSVALHGARKNPKSKGAEIYLLCLVSFPPNLCKSTVNVKIFWAMVFPNLSANLRKYGRDILLGPWQPLWCTLETGALFFSQAAARGQQRG